MAEADGVSWKLVESLMGDWAGLDGRLEEMQLLTGGLVNTTVALKLRDGRRAVLKVSDHRVNHAHGREARELEMLSGLGVPVPRVYAVRTASFDMPHSYLIMEHVPGESLKAIRARLTEEELESIERELADVVLKIHAVTGDRYGRLEGATFTDWPGFYHSLVDPVLEEADKLHCLPGKTTKVIHRVHERLDSLLAHGDSPRLLHGDLWSANIMCRRDESGRWRLAALIDPEMRFGHVEAELAYLELFKTITPAFKQQYQKQFRLPDGYHQRRKHVYQLYGLINQLQMHGPAYAEPVCEAADKLAPLL